MPQARKRPDQPSISAEEKEAARQETTANLAGEPDYLAPLRERIAEIEREQQPTRDEIAALQAKLSESSVELEQLHNMIAIRLGKPVSIAAKRPASGGTGTRAPRGANQDAILKVISERPGVSPTEIASATGIVKAVVYSTLKKMADKGEIAKEDLPGGTVGYKTS